MLAFRNPSDRFPDKVKDTPRDYALTDNPYDLSMGRL